MAKSSVAENRKGLKFATDVQIFVIEKAPDPIAEAIMQKAITRLRSHYGTSRDLKMERILSFMRSDESGDSVSIAELVEHFAWHRDLVTDLIAQMLAAQPPRVEKFKAPSVNVGRPAWRYRLPRASFAPPKI